MNVAGSGALLLSVLISSAFDFRFGLFCRGRSFGLSLRPSRFGRWGLVVKWFVLLFSCCCRCGWVISFRFFPVEREGVFVAVALLVLDEKVWFVGLTGRLTKSPSRFMFPRYLCLVFYI